MTQSFPKIWIIAILAVVAAGGFFTWQYFGVQKPIACTEEAKICPDGSAVGRIGSDCEFAACPAVSPDETADWQIYRNEEYGFEVKYPDNIFKLKEDTANLSHTLNNFHLYSEKDGSDLGLANDIIITFKKDADKCNGLETSLKDIAFPFKLANLRGLEYETGAEGVGVVYYCFKNDKDKNVFLIERWFLSEAYSIELPKQPDYISSERQKEIFNQILSTFRFLE